MASTPKCAVCGNSTTKKGKKIVCETCGYSAEYSKDFEVPIDFMKEIQEEFHPLNVVSDLDKDEIKQNISDYLNYKTKLKAKEAELKLKQVESQLNKANSVVLSEDENTKRVELPPSTFALNYLFKLPKEEREEFLQMLGEHPEWAVAFSYLINPTSVHTTQNVPFAMPPFAFPQPNGSGEAIAESLKTMTSFFQSYLELMKESMTQKNDSVVELLKVLLPNLVQNQPNYAEIINAAQSNTISLLQTLLQQNKQLDPLQLLEFVLSMSQPNQSASDKSEKNEVLEIIKLLLPNIIERSNKQTEDLLRTLISLLKEKEEKKKENAVRVEGPVSVRRDESIANRLKELKEEVEALEELGIVQRPKPLVVEKDGDRYRIVEAEKKKEPSIEDKIKLEQWELEKEKKKTELELLKKEKELELEKKKAEEEKEKEYELEKLRTFNTLISGGTQLASALFGGNDNEEKELKKIEISDNKKAEQKQMIDEKDLEDVDVPLALDDDKKDENKDYQPPSERKIVKIEDVQKAASNIKKPKFI